MIEYNPLPSAVKFHEARTRVKVAWGPLGSGKTSLGLWEFVLSCLESNIPLDGMVIRSSYRELRDNTLKTFTRWFGDVSTWREGDSLAILRLPAANGSATLEHVLRFRSLERPDDAKKVQGFEGSFVMLDEVSPTFSSTGRASEGIPLEVVEYTNARMRHMYQGQEAARYTQVILSNPPQPEHWLNKHFLSKPTEDLARRKGGVSVHFIPRRENESNLPHDYYAILCDAFHDPDLVRRLVDGEIVATYTGVAVFPEAKQHIHITNEPLKPVQGIPLVLGFDYGLTPSTLITQITPTGQWRWLSEVHTFNGAFDSHLEMLRIHMNDRYPGWEIRSWGDPAGEQRAQTDEKTCVELAQAAGISIKPGRQDWQSRKESIKQRLLRNDANGQPALLVSRAGCPIAAEGLCGAYRYPKTAAGEIGTRPIKNHPFSDVMDCAEYIATREFQINPKAFQPEPRPEGFIPIRPLDPFRPMLRSQRGRRTSWMSR